MEIIKKWGLTAGLAILVGSHIWMAIYGLPESQMMWHWIANLGAAVLIYVGADKKIF